MTNTPDIKADIRSTVDDLKGKAAHLAEEAKAEGSGLIDAARDRAETFAAEHKETGAEQAETVSRALDSAAEEFEEASPLFAGYVRDAAASVQDLANAFRDRSPRALLQDVTDLARRQPVGFFGASVLAGFALARFARATTPGRDAPDGKGATAGCAHQSPLPAGASNAPGWNPTGPHDTPRPATLAAASLGGAAAFHARRDR